MKELSRIFNNFFHRQYYYIAYKSPEISVNKFVLDYRYKKSVETCRAHRKSGIAKHHAKR